MPFTTVENPLRLNNMLRSTEYNIQVECIQVSDDFGRPRKLSLHKTTR